MTAALLKAEFELVGPAVVPSLPPDADAHSFSESQVTGTSRWHPGWFRASLTAVGETTLFTSVGQI